MKRHMDINADVGEGLDNELQLMPFISSCNIACGGHAGDEKSMKGVVELCKQFGVKIGAHPSFPDRENFGRVSMDMSFADLYASLKQQIRNLLALVRQNNLSLHHIKPHGALYNLAIKDEKIAQVIIEVIKSISMPVKLYAPYASLITTLAKAEGIPVVYEAFIDRNYNTDLSLVSRQKENAVISNPVQAYKHIWNMVQNNNVRTLDGSIVNIEAATYCIHGDNPNALEILEYITKELKENDVFIR